MQFQPKTEEQLNADRLQPGIAYDFEITKAEDTTSKKGNPMIAMEMQIFTPSGKQKQMKDWLVASMEWKLRHLCASVGVMAQYEAGSLAGADLVGRTGKVILKVEKQEGDFPDKLVVKDYSGEKANVSTAPVAPVAPRAVAQADPNEPPF